jgi:hypothetical protein
MDFSPIKHGRAAYKLGCRCDDCRAANAAGMAAWRAKNPIGSAQYQREWRQDLRSEVINHYGGKCVCCGEDKLPFLSLDHKNGGGTKHRNELGLRGSGIWAWAKRHGFPDMFQVLCHNCNQAKGYYGFCPHQSE